MSNTIRNAKRNHFTLDLFNKKIMGSKKSFDKASTGSGEYYEELMHLMAQHPDFELVIKTTESKKTYKGLDEDLMKDYIAIQENGTQLRKEYDEIKKKSEEANLNDFQVLRKWFLKKFSSKENPFDVKKAQEAIYDAKYNKVTNINSQDTTEDSEHAEILNPAA